MRFGPWYPLADAPSHAPRRPGVFQVRRERGLVQYPRGRAAMVHYDAGPQLRAAVTAFATAHPGAALLCRWSRDPAPDPAAALERLLRDFEARFGAPPRDDARPR